MTDRALLTDGSIIQLYNSEKGLVDIVEPVAGTHTCTAPVIGWQYTDDGGRVHKVVSATLNEVDNSTGPNKARDDTGWVVAGDTNSVSRTITIRDKTAQEIDDDKNETVAKLDLAGGFQVADARCLKMVIGKMFSDSGLTAQQFKAELESHKDTITDAQFKEFLKGLL